MIMKNKVLKKCISIALSLAVVSTIIVMPTSELKVYAAEEYAGSIINPDFKPQIVVTKSDSGFTHPGIFLSAEDLDRIQKMVRGGYEPWASAFDEFRKNPKASKDYVIQNLDSDGNPKYIQMAISNGQYEARADANAAYAQALMWYITGDSDYSNKALKIIRSWYTSLTTNSPDILTSGMSLQKFCFAAEVLRYTPSSGWTDSDTEGFTKFLNIETVTTDVDSKWMNQGSIGTMGYIASAIFRNDSTAYAKGIERAAVGVNDKKPEQGFSIKHQFLSTTDPTTGKEEIFPAELGRDQAHAADSVNAIASLAQLAYVQGTKINENGTIVTDGTGVSLYQFMDNRLLKADNTFEKYNLGYDVYYPVTQVGVAVAQPTVYKDVSTVYRGTLGHNAMIYNHYKYKENVSDDDEDMKYVKMAVNNQAPEGDSQEFFGYGTLLFTPEQAVTNSNDPKEAPKPLDIPDYSEKTKEYDRFQAANFTGTQGVPEKDTGKIATESFKDNDGTRLVISGIKDSYYVWYKDIDFGSIPVDKMVMRAGSTPGCKIDVILLDNVAGIDFNNVTRDNLAAGETIASAAHAPATGWWSNYTTFTIKFNKKLIGKHSFAIKFYGSGHVYGYQANVDWFKFANASAQEDNNAVDADQLLNGAVKEDDHINFVNGSAILYKGMDFDSGSGAMTAKLATTSEGKVEIRSGSPEGELVASYDIPNTNGEFKDIKRNSDSGKTIYGINDIYIVYKGEGKLKLKTYKNSSIKLDFPKIEGEQVPTVLDGTISVINKDNMSYISTKATQAGTTIVYPSINYNYGPSIIALRVRSNKTAQVSLSNTTKKNPTFATFTIPNTNGKWTNVYCDISKASKKITSNNMTFMTFTGDDAIVDFDYMQFDPLNVAPVIKSELADISTTVNINAGSDYYLKLNASDMETNTPTLAAQQLPEGASFDSDSGIFTWKPTDKDTGAHTVLFTADDGDTTTVSKVDFVVH
jgi:hypothetical protein